MPIGASNSMEVANQMYIVMNLTIYYHSLSADCPAVGCEYSCSPPWELELRPLGVATGNALSVTRV